MDVCYLHMATTERALRFLQDHTLMTMASVTPDGIPHAASLYYVVEPDFSIYCVTREETQKYQNIRQNSSVSMVITDEESAETVQLVGKAVKVDDEHQIAGILQRLWTITMKKQHWPAPVIKLNEGGLLVLKIIPTELKYGDFKPIHLENGVDYIKKVI